MHSLRAVFDDPVRVKIIAAFCRAGFHESLKHQAECLLMLAVKFYPLVTDDFERLTEAGEVLDAGHVCCLNKLYGEQIMQVHMAFISPHLAKT